MSLIFLFELPSQLVFKGLHPIGFPLVPYSDGLGYNLGGSAAANVALDGGSLHYLPLEDLLANVRFSFTVGQGGSVPDILSITYVTLLFISGN